MSQRLHHYIPRFFLDGFTDAEGFLHVLDLQQGRWWKGRPERVARQRDFYRVDAPELEPNEIEQGFSKIEAELAPMVKRLLERRAMPVHEDPDFALLLNLVAMMASRVPGARDALTQPIRAVGEQLLKILAARPELYERYLADQRAKGEDTSDALPFEKMKQAIESGGIEVAVHQNHQVAAMLQGTMMILPMLPHRNWCTVSAAPEAGPLVCGDRPVTLSWVEQMPAFYSPGFGTGKTELALPVSRDLALLSAFETLPASIEAVPEIVAVLNSRAVGQAERYVFSPRPYFSALGPDGQVTDSDELIAHVQRQTAHNE